MSSTRLPGKVLLDLVGKPMLARQLERLKRSRLMREIIVATSSEESDDPISRFCEDNQVTCFRGSIDDVLDRYYQCALVHRPDHLVRLTADCPLADPEVIDRIIAAHLNAAADYTSNTLVRTYPKGLDVEVMTVGALSSAWKNATAPFEREHVMPYLYDPPNGFKLHNVKRTPDISEMRWTVDYQEDFEFVCTIYRALYDGKPAFDTEDILALLARKPGVARLNQQCA